MAVACPQAYFCRAAAPTLPAHPTESPHTTPVQLHDDIRYRVLKALEEHPEISQRELAETLGVSLGKANFCLRALIDKGLVKVRNFRRKDNKLAYAYLLTPAGIAEKVSVTRRFLQRKITEYDALKAEIEALQHDLADPQQTQNQNKHP